MRNEEEPLKSGSSSFRPGRNLADMFIARWLAVVVMLALVGVGAGSAQTSEPAHWEFGFSLATGMNNQLYTCFLVKIHEDSVISRELITAEQFILQAKGLVKSKANPAGADLFREHRIDLCNQDQASTVQEQIDACDPFATVWKLRFQEWPFKEQGGTHETGWAETPLCPSERQMFLLHEHGMHHYLDIVHGASAFSLLKNVRDPEWVANYTQGL